MLTAIEDAKGRVHLVNTDTVVAIEPIVVEAGKETSRLVLPNTSLVVKGAVVLVGMELELYEAPADSSKDQKPQLPGAQDTQRPSPPGRR